MSMTKAELMNAFRDAACAEFADYSPYESDYSYEFSERFERRMDRLVKSESKPAWRFVNTNLRRLIIIAIVIVLALTAFACAVPEIRESIAGFFVRMFSDHAEIIAPDSLKQSIDNEYYFLSIPDGFSLIKKEKGIVFINTEYQDNMGNTLYLRQTVDSVFPSMINNENADYLKCIINNNIVLVQYSECYAHAIWKDDGYSFYLSYSAGVTPETFESLISAITKEW